MGIVDILYIALVMIVIAILLFLCSIFVGLLCKYGIVQQCFDPSLLLAFV